MNCWPPAYGPADIVIEGNRIAEIRMVGADITSIRPEDRPKLKAGGREMDLAGYYVMPGLIDMHGHIGGDEQGVSADYVYKLWMGHGITTVRDQLLPKMQAEYPDAKVDIGILAAIEKTLDPKSGAPRTPDLGGKAGTTDVGKAGAQALAGL